MSRHRVRVSKNPRHTGRWVIFILLGLLVAGLGGVLGYDFIRSYQTRRLADRARGYLSIGDLHSAALTCKTILQMNPHQVDAARILAQIAEQNGERSALDWRQHVMAEAPESEKDGVALARTAINQGELGLAESTLNHFVTSGAGDPAYHAATGALYLARKNSAAAEKEYEIAIRLEPANEEYRLALSILELNSASGEKRTAARTALRALLENKTVRLRAARALLTDAIERRDPELVSLSEQIFNWPEATIQDRLLYVELSSKLNLPSFPGALAQVQDEAPLDPAKLTELLSWMSENHQAVLALEWVKRLPPAALQKRPVFVALADCYIAASDCDGLRQWLRGFGWKDLEYLRHAYLALASRRCSDSAEGEVEWARALQAANDTPAILTLQKAAAKWGWEKESVDLLWQLTKDRDQQLSALSTLNDYYSARSDTNNLYKVTSRWLQVVPNDPKVKNNFAQLSLLLGVNTSEALAMAKELYQTDAKNADYASTYAFALYNRGDFHGALKIMNALPGSDLQRPEIAVYYGIILQAANDRAKALSYLELGRQAKLLPEEKALLEKASGASSNLR